MRKLLFLPIDWSRPTTPLAPSLTKEGDFEPPPGPLLNQGGGFRTTPLAPSLTKEGDFEPPPGPLLNQGGGFRTTPLAPSLTKEGNHGFFLKSPVMPLAAFAG